MMCINFVSTNISNNINYSIPCVGTDLFAEIEEKLYKQFPELRETNNTFLSNGKEILRFKTVEENKIGTGFPILFMIPS